MDSQFDFAMNCVIARDTYFRWRKKIFLSN
jgi:hypothetical protein